MRAVPLALITALLMTTGCATSAPPPPPSPPTAQQQIAAAVQDALPPDLLKGMVTDADVTSLFAVLRAALKGQDAEMPKELDQKLEKLAQDLPARIEPLMDKLLTIAEKEVRKGLQEGKPAQ
jgi:hypothetical protein